MIANYLMLKHKKSRVLSPATYKEEWHPRGMDAGCQVLL